MRFIDGLCPETIHLLPSLHHNSKHHRVRQRALCMILSHQRYTPSQLAQMFDVNLKTIYNWFLAFEQQKLPGRPIGQRSKANPNRLPATPS